MLRQLATTIALLGAAPVAALAADVPYAPQTTYGVYRGGTQIGRHTITFQQKGPAKVVTFDCEIDVKTLGVTSYRYVYRGREEWDGEQLQALQASTDDNGQRFTVSAERRGSNLVVERTAPAKVATAALMDQGYRGPDVGREALPADIMPTSQWNVRQVQQSRLLNTQYGTVSRVQVSPAGRETVQIGKSSVTATRYRYTGDLRMDQWFDDRGRWVKGAFTAFDGSTIEYILQE
jgi:hypothetical protein